MYSVFDIVMREDDFILYLNGKPFHTPFGNEVVHTDARLLTLSINHGRHHIEVNTAPLILLGKMMDVRAGSTPVFDFDIEEELKNDPLLQNGNYSSLVLPDDNSDNDSAYVDFVFLNSSTLASSFNNFLLQKEENQSDVNFVRQVITGFPPEKQSILNGLAMENRAGLTIHCMLLNDFLSLTEYAAGIIILKLKYNLSLTLRSWQLENISVLNEIMLKIMANTAIAIDFLRLYQNKNKISVMEEIIKRGEDSQTEFKSTLRWDLHQGIKSSAIEHASLKTVCAFLNSEGGDLIIGVKDDGTIQGIETDQFENNDRFLLHLWTLLRTCIGKEVGEWIKTSIQKFGNKTVCRVNCSKAGTPVFLRQKGMEETFYIRTGPSSNSLEISSALKYIEQHF